MFIFACFGVVVLFALLLGTFGPYFQAKWKIRRLKTRGVGCEIDWAEVDLKLRRGEGTLVIITPYGSSTTGYLWTREHLKQDTDAMDICGHEETFIPTVPPIRYFLCNTLLQYAFPRAHIVRLRCPASF